MGTLNPTKKEIICLFQNRGKLTPECQHVLAVAALKNGPCFLDEYQNCKMKDSELNTPMDPKRFPNYSCLSNIKEKLSPQCHQQILTIAKDRDEKIKKARSIWQMACAEEYKKCNKPDDIQGGVCVAQMVKAGTVTEKCKKMANDYLNRAKKKK